MKFICLLGTAGGGELLLAGGSGHKKKTRDVMEYQTTGARDEHQGDPGARRPVAFWFSDEAEVACSKCSTGRWKSRLGRPDNLE